MRAPHTLCTLVLGLATAGLATSACKSLECAPGTIEQANQCVPASEVVSSASCGMFTELQGGVCVPQFPPTSCDPATTTESLDPATGVTTCIGTGAATGCSGAFACPPPTTGKQTVCGQLYDLDTGAPFADGSATGSACTIGAGSSGPCAVAIQAFDAIAFAQNPTTTQPLAVGKLEIDDCGRFRLTDITPGAGPLIALGTDDALPGNRGPAGVTQPTGVAFPKAPGQATPGIEDFIVSAATTDAWAASGGPATTVGIYVALFRAHVAGLASKAGVTVVKNGVGIGSDVHYFTPGSSVRETIDPAAVATGSDGAALITNGSLVASYSGSGGEGPNCQWDAHPGAAVPNVVFVQIFRPEDSGGTCAQ